MKESCRGTTKTGTDRGCLTDWVCFGRRPPKFGMLAGMLAAPAPVRIGDGGAELCGVLTADPAAGTAGSARGPKLLRGGGGAAGAGRAGGRGAADAGMLLPLAEPTRRQVYPWVMDTNII